MLPREGSQWTCRLVCFPTSRLESRSESARLSRARIPRQSTHRASKETLCPQNPKNVSLLLLRYCSQLRVNDTAAVSIDYSYPCVSIPSTDLTLAHHSLQHRHAGRYQSADCAGAGTEAARTYAGDGGAGNLPKRRSCRWAWSFTPFGRTSTRRTTRSWRWSTTSSTGTEHGLRDFLFPSLRQTYEDLLDAATKPVRADLLLLGELNYAGPIVAEMTGIPWASYVLAPLSFFSAFDPPVLPPYPQAGEGRQEGAGNGARDQAAWRGLRAANGPSRFTSCGTNWDYRAARIRYSMPSIRRTWCWRCFRAYWARSKRTGRRTRSSPVSAYYDADAGNAEAARASLKKFLASGEPPVVFTLGSAAVLAAGRFLRSIGEGRDRTGDTGGAVDRC